ncbi:hypothetical protein [Acinetobacter baumannii]|uniref:hypothetical protein n=1 Tax=Acinetobacter baumannii TaxID=470 RepID=UPI001020F093|nr:hypothetical protein [Acinetobacter baumannii]RYL13363.1 hypothetical protein EWO92_19925 [Acinetobacter baumannii]RYL41292.1 hypothetical protein EWP49_20065 [Acinetobacter baumannii]
MAGGSQIIINKDGITIITPAKFEAKAGQHLFKSGAQADFSVPSLPDLENPYILQYIVKNKENKILANKSYILFDEDGNIQKGKTDQNGLMKLKTTPSEQNIFTRVFNSEIEEADDGGSAEE